MCSTIEKKHYEFGFSLLELAIVMVIAGLIIAPAMQIYHNYRIDKDWEETENNKALIVQEVGSFRTLFGRYPCPASITAVPGDIDYGLETAGCHVLPPLTPSYPADGTCANGVCAYNNGGKKIIVGAFPYKITDLFESESYDSKNSRFLYAVTANLTDSTAFDITNGGVGIINKAGTSVIQPPNSAHFVIVSHGNNKIGGYTKSGILTSACANGSAAEQENCDADGVFLSSGIDDDFDDRIAFFSAAPYAEWQKSIVDQNMIHLKNSNGIAVGASTATDLSAAEETTVKSAAIDTGSVLAQGDFFVQRLCDENAINIGTDCFAPRLIAGDLTPDPAHSNRLEANTNPGYGISCYDKTSGDDEYLIGIENNAPICSDEIFISCPDGSFIKGIDANGVVKCNTAPLPRCYQVSKNTSCHGKISTNTTGNISDLVGGTPSGGVEFLYSGECRMITDYDGSYFASKAPSFSDFDDVKDHIELLNDANGNGNKNDDRTVVDCSAGEAGSQVRDAYLCTAGNWSKISTHEKVYPYWNNFSSNPVGNGGAWYWPAEMNYGGSDNANTNGNHDCWCREDYRTRKVACTDGTLRAYVIEKRKCPQTWNSWNNVYTNTDLCTCVETTTNNNLSCNEYYDELKPLPPNTTTGILGNVTKKFNITCPTGPSGPSVQDPNPYDVEAASCKCIPNGPNEVITSYCPSGKTNSWFGPSGTPYIGVDGLDINSFVCPSGDISDSFGNNIPNPGANSNVAYSGIIPPCKCDNNLTKIVSKSCPSNLQNSTADPNPIKYEVEWDCNILPNGGWEPESDWELLTPDTASVCSSCKWESSGAGTPSGGAYETILGDICNCSLTPRICTELNASGIGTDPHLTHASCQCTVQN